MFKKIIPTLLALLTAASSFSQDKDMARRLQGLMPQYAALNQFTGTIVLAHSGKVIYTESFGMANKDLKTANTAETLYNMGSIGKMFTAAAVLQLAEKGKIKLDAPISTYLGEYHLPNADKITAINLLTHTSGYGSYMRSGLYKNAEPHTLDDLLKIIAVQPLVFDTPSSDIAYSNSAFVILGRMVEKASGQEWWEYFRDNIFKPAGMSNVHRCSPGEKADHKALGYDCNTAGDFSEVTNDPMPYTDGGLYATAQELIKFLDALRKGKLMTDAGLSAMTKKYVPYPAFHCEMGLGWEISQSGPIEMIAKGGNVPGFSAQMIMLPDGYSLVLMSNMSSGAFSNLEDIIQCLYGLKKPAPKMASSAFIYQQLQQTGWEKLAPELQTTVEKNGYEYNPRDLVFVAMTMKDRKQYPLAVDLMQYYMKEKANYKFGYYFLGSVYELMDDKQKAAESYKMLVSLDPSNDEAAAKVKELEAAVSSKY